MSGLVAPPRMKPIGMNKIIRLAATPGLARILPRHNAPILRAINVLCGTVLMLYGLHLGYTFVQFF